MGEKHLARHRKSDKTITTTMTLIKMQQASPIVKTRRHHQKSRSGCFECKRRRIRVNNHCTLQDLQRVEADCNISVTSLNHRVSGVPHFWRDVSIRHNHFAPTTTREMNCLYPTLHSVSIHRHRCFLQLQPLVLCGVFVLLYHSRCYRPMLHRHGQSRSPF